MGVITPFITGWGPPCKNLKSMQSYNMMTTAVRDDDDEEEEETTTTTMMMMMMMLQI